MALDIQKHNAFTNNVYLTEQLDEASVAVRFVVLLFKRTLVELFETERADEMFRMEFPVHGSDTSPGNRFLATVA